MAACAERSSSSYQTDDRLDHPQRSQPLNDGPLPPGDRDRSDGSDVTERLGAPFVELGHEHARDPVLVQLDHLAVDRDSLGKADAGTAPLASSVAS